MDLKQLRKTLLLLAVAYALCICLFYFVSDDRLNYKETVTSPLIAEEAIGEILSTSDILQPFAAEGDELCSVRILLSTFNRPNDCLLRVTILDEAGQCVVENEIPTETLADNEFFELIYPQPIPLEKGGQYALELSSPDGSVGNAVTAWRGEYTAVAHAQLKKQLSASECLQINHVRSEGMLVFSQSFRTNLTVGRYYWPVCLGLGALMLIAAVLLYREAAKNKSCFVLRIFAAFYRYKFLIKQLVSRDFKAKYKRSVMGALWSFLNPLLTMIVQYIVFSTIFKSDIPNFPLYLLVGIICFNFFNEATMMALQSIVGNANLITKVYVPKYIYPLSRILSSTVNLLLSIIPIFGVMLITRAPFSAALLMLPYGLLCLVAMSLGVGLLLATFMVFFRDTQFLWGVISLLWMYLTPVFYPENIIPAKYLTLYHCNPLYQIIQFLRCIIINGTSPSPDVYLACLMSALIPLAIGAGIFKKYQDRFIFAL